MVHVLSEYVKKSKSDVFSLHLGERRPKRVIVNCSNEVMFL